MSKIPARLMTQVNSANSILKFGAQEPARQLVHLLCQRHQSCPLRPPSFPLNGGRFPTLVRNNESSVDGGARNWDLRFRPNRVRLRGKMVCPLRPLATNTLEV